MKKSICLLLSLLMLSIFCGCEYSDKEQNDGISIVAVSFPEYDFARAVAGENANITMLIPPAGEAHGYEPTVSDIKAVGNCNLFIYTGGESDTWAEDILGTIKNKDDIHTLTLTSCVEGLCTEEHDHDHDHDHHEHDHNKYTFDEHVWTSPKNAIEIVESIKNALCKIDPENSAVYEKNAAAYTNKLSDLDQSFRKEIHEKENPTLVFGDRFPLVYFANEYNLEYQAAFSGCSDDTEASASTIAQLINFVRDNNINIIFTNELSNTAIAQQIAKETGASVRTFYSCHKVSKDDFESGKTYVDIMSRNIENLNIALK